MREIFPIWTFHLVKCEDLLLFSVLCHFKLNILRFFWLIFSQNKQSEYVASGSENLWLAFFIIFWHFEHQTNYQTKTVRGCCPKQRATIQLIRQKTKNIQVLIALLIQTSCLLPFADESTSVQSQQRGSDPGIHTNIHTYKHTVAPLLRLFAMHEKAFGSFPPRKLDVK